MDKDEKFTMLPERPGIFIRKGGWYRNESGGGVKIAFKLNTTDHALQEQTGRNFEELSEEIIQQEVANLHNSTKSGGIVYSTNGTELRLS